VLRLIWVADWKGYLRFRATVTPGKSSDKASVRTICNYGNLAVSAVSDDMDSSAKLTPLQVHRLTGNSLTGPEVSELGNVRVHRLIEAVSDICVVLSQCPRS
jgi:hypothetical protein